MQWPAKGTNWKGVLRFLMGENIIVKMRAMLD